MDTTTCKVCGQDDLRVINGNVTRHGSIDQGECQGSGVAA